MADEETNRGAFRWQAAFARKSASPVTALLCDALAAVLDRSTALGARVLDWPGEPIRDALSLRVTGGLHALVRAGRAPALVPIFAGTVRDPAAIAAAVMETVAASDGELVGWLAGPPQTNEAGRSAVLMAGLLALATRFDVVFDLIEIGSSAGLNLLIDRYRFDLGGVAIGPGDAPLRFAPDWRGTPPPAPQVRIGSVRGVDVAPIDLADPAQAERLTAYVWPDQHDRLDRLARAIALALVHPPTLDRGDAADWVEARLAEPTRAGTGRVLMHSVVWQYLPPEGRARIETAMAAAGSRAAPDRPLGWLAYEGERNLDRHGLVLRCWPGDGMPRRLASAHPHGAWIEWLGDG